MNLNIIFEISGYSGGFILGGCLIPQIYQSIKTNSTKDISLVWTLMYSLGLILLMCYSIYNNLLAVYIPGLVELFCLYILIFLKIKYDYCNKSYDILEEIQINDKNNYIDSYTK